MSPYRLTHYVWQRSACLLAAIAISTGNLSALEVGIPRSSPVKGSPRDTKSDSRGKRKESHTNRSVPHILQADGKMNNADLLSPSICEASCFAATYSFSTVPYYSLDQPRNVTIVYNADQASPRPYIFADVNGDDGTGVNINQFTMSATVNGAAVTFLTGSTLLTFSGALGPVRLSGQFNASTLSTNVYPLVITVKAFYADGTNVQKSITTKLMVLNEAGAPAAKGWTIAGVQRIYSTIGSGYLITGGDGSGVRFSALGAKGADYSRVTYDAGSATYTRTYSDGSRVIFNSSGAETSAIDANGRISTLGYDANGRIQTISDPYRKQPNGSATFITLTYDANGLTRIQEPSADGTPGAGRSTTFSVDGTRCLLSAQDPDAITTHFNCDASGRLSTITDRRGGMTTFGYSAVSWKLSQVTLPQIAVDAGGGTTTLTNPVIRYGPWQDGGSAWIQDPAGRMTYFSVNPFGQAVDITDPAGLHTVVTTYGILPTRITHPSGWTDTVMYDTLGRVTRNHPAGGSPTDYQYIPANSLTPTLLVVTGAGSRLDSLSLNAIHQVYHGTYTGTPRQTLDFLYDPATLQLSSSTDNAGHRTSYAYDARFGNLQSATNAAGRVTSAKLFDSYGRDSVVTPIGLASQTSLYDILNRITSESAAGVTITFGYDQLFRTDVYDGYSPSNHYHTDYNALGWPTNECDPFSLCATTRYDASGLAMSTTNRRGQILSVGRDGAGRITSKSGAGIVASNFSYNSNGHDMVAWNAVERDSVFVNPGTLTIPASDSVVTWIDGKRYRIFHRFPSAVAGVDSLNIISNTGITFLNRVANYSSSGFLTSFKFGSTAAGWTNFPLTPNADGTGGAVAYLGFNRTDSALATHLTGSVNFSNGLASTFNRLYHYNSSGRIDQVMLGSGLSTQQAFSYDNLGRLTQFDVRTGCSLAGRDTLDGSSYSCPTVVSSSVYSYDAMGNRTDHGGVPAVGNRYAADNGGTYYYDSDGNVTQKYKDMIYNKQYYWSAENQLDSAIRDSWYRTDYDYNAFGKPVRVWSGDPNGRQVARYLLWDGEALLAELTPSGQREVDYLYFPGAIDHPFAHTEGATSPTEVRYHEVDELGNVVGTSAGSSVSQSNSYDTWGTVSYSGNADQHLTWKGLWWNGDLTGLYYMRGRWYEPEGGRFVNEDPAGFAGGYNLYAFSGNDPVNGTDPSGLSAIACQRLYRYSHVIDDGWEEYGWVDAVCSGGGAAPALPPDPYAGQGPSPQGATGAPHGGPGGGGGANPHKPTTQAPSHPGPITEGLYKRAQCFQRGLNSGVSTITGASAVLLSIAGNSLGKAAWAERMKASKMPDYVEVAEDEFLANAAKTEALRSSSLVLRASNFVAEWVVPAAIGFSAGYIVGAAGACSVNPAYY
jgi:RHS repeat-associated protein